MLKKYNLIATCFFVFMFSACATIFSGTKDLLPFNSHPQGAEIFINGIKYGKTPAVIPIERSTFSSPIVTLRLSGYEEKSFILSRSFNAISLFNLFGVGFGFIIDAATGAMMRYEVHSYNFDLEQRRDLLKSRLGVEKVHFTHELPKDAQGHGVVHATPFGEVAVVDEELGQAVVFSK